jgi:hypothetical protein
MAMKLESLLGAGLLLTLVSAMVSAQPVPRGSARAAWVAGKHATSSEERRRRFAEGVTAARALLAANPDDPEGLLWLSANLGSEALERGKLSALRVIPEMERLLLLLDAHHPLYDHAAAARTLGVLYSKAPALISIGSDRKARQYFEKALQRAGDYPPTQILAAEFFDDEGEHERARALARAYLAAPASEAEEPDAAEWRRTAERIAGTGR